MKLDSQYILPIVKLHGLGNDFILVDARDLESNALGQALLSNWQEHSQELATFLCERHFSIGGDGLILALNLKEPRQRSAAQSFYGSLYQSADLAWLFTNSDGSPSNMCGNALRCFGLWARNRAIVGKRFDVLTQSGIVAIVYHTSQEIEIILGGPKLSAQSIPYRANAGVCSPDQIVQEPFAVNGTTYAITCVNLGNPHCVVFANDLLEKYDLQLPLERNKRRNFFPTELQTLATLIQGDARFPEGTNVEFARSKSRSSVETIVFERGCGATLACGSGAMAVLVAGVLEGRLDRDAEVTLPGGTLKVSWSELDNEIHMVGAAEQVFVGQTALPEFLIRRINAGPAAPLRLNELAVDKKSDSGVKAG